MKLLAGAVIISRLDCRKVCFWIHSYSCWLFADWALSSSWSQVGLGKWKPVVLSPCITSILAAMAILFMSLLGNGRGGWRKRLMTLYGLAVLATCMLKSSEIIHMGQSIFHILCLFKNSCLHTSFLDLLATNFLTLFLPNPWQSCQAIKPQLLIWYRHVPLGISSIIPWYLNVSLLMEILTLSNNSHGILDNITF